MIGKILIAILVGACIGIALANYNTKNDNLVLPEYIGEYDAE